MSDTPAPSRFETRIRLADVLTLGAMLAAIGLSWSDIKSDLAVEAQRLNAVEMRLVSADADHNKVIELGVDMRQVRQELDRRSGQ